MNFSVKELRLIIMSIFQEWKLRLFDSFKLVSKIAELDISDPLSLEDFVFEVFIFFFEQLNRVFIVIFHL